MCAIFGKIIKEVALNQNLGHLGHFGEPGGILHKQIQLFSCYVSENGLVLQFIASFKSVTKKQ